MAASILKTDLLSLLNICKRSTSVYSLRHKYQTSTSRVLSGIQPTGIPHIGNYLGAIKKWVQLQDEYTEVLYTVVDLHALTVPSDPKELRENIQKMAASLLACGIDPNKSILFQQSQVPHHTDLAWVLGCICSLPRLQHLPQWKEKSKSSDSSGVGLLTYPILQAADILIYRASHVPVGEDQIHHLELTRDLAKSFNNKFNFNFPLPSAIMGDSTRIKNLKNPSVKMSKSEPNEKTRISLTDLPDDISEKIKKSLTDSLPGISYDAENRKGMANLLEIYSAFTDQDVETVCQQCSTLNKVEFKDKLAEIVIEHLKPIRQEIDRLLLDKCYLHKVLSDGKDKAAEITYNTWTDVQKCVGIS